MNRFTPLRSGTSPTSAPDPAAPHNVPAVRAVRRAVLEARGGVPVIIDQVSPLVALPAETASVAGLAELMGAARGPALLLLAPTRAAAVLHHPGRPRAGGRHCPAARPDRSEFPAGAGRPDASAGSREQQHCHAAAACRCGAEAGQARAAAARRRRGAGRSGGGAGAASRGCGRRAGLPGPGGG